MNPAVRPSLVVVVLLAAALGGCSQGRELRTQGQASGFVVEVAGGEPATSWTLAGKPAPEASRAWADRKMIADLGHRLRSEGATWACEFAHKSVGLGSIGYFDENDAGIVTREAAGAGVPMARISPTLHDVVTLRFRELVLLTTSICGPYKS